MKKSASIPAKENSIPKNSQAIPFLLPQISLFPQHDPFCSSFNQTPPLNFSPDEFRHTLQQLQSLSQEDIDPSVYAPSGLSRLENISKLFVDSQPQLHRTDSINGNEEVNSSLSLMQILPQIRPTNEFNKTEHDKI